MPRKARKLSESGIYHIMIRGIGKQLIFEDEEDYMCFLELLREYRDVCDFKLYAYCLMGNHAHLLIKIQQNNLDSVFKHIGSRYVYWYNAKYKRVGHLFQDRFKSEPVEDDTYFLTVIRYIHQNPVKASICSKPENYKFSSYTEYTLGEKIVDTEYALKIMGLDEFIRFNNEKNSDKCLEISVTDRYALTDEQAKQIIKKISHCENITQFQGLNETKKANCIKKIHDKGVSIRQLSRLTGTSKGMVEKWLKS